MFKAIDEYELYLIEKALGFKLYDWQVDLLYDISDYMPSERRSGKTMAFVLKMLIRNKRTLFVSVNNNDGRFRYKELVRVKKLLEENCFVCPSIHPVIGSESASYFSGKDDCLFI